MGIILTIAVFSTGVSPYINGQLVPFGYAIPTVLACRLFREVRLGSMSDADTSPALAAVSSAVFARNTRDEHNCISESETVHAEYEMDVRATKKPP